MSIAGTRDAFERALVVRETTSLQKKAPGLSAESAEIIARNICLERRGEGYAAFVPDTAWWAWKASREELVIELPDHYGYDDPGEAIHAISDCRKAIEDAGLKVKP